MTTSIKQSLKSGAKDCMPTLLLAASLALGAASSVSAGQGNQGNPGILPSQSHVQGKSYGQWAAAWWEWAYSIPADQNPITDTTGEFSGVGQSGPVFFLAGNYGGITVRECTVPAGKALLFPLLNQSWVQFPSDPPFSIAELRDIVAPFVDDPALECEIDGRPVQNLLDYREQSSVFSITVPEGNLLGLDPGTYAPCLDDGYYLMLAPLQSGRHTIHFTAQTADHGFSLDVTYHLTVK
jgi:hypothetical protein